VHAWDRINITLPTPTYSSPLSRVYSSFPICKCIISLYIHTWHVCLHREDYYFIFTTNLLFSPFPYFTKHLSASLANHGLLFTSSRFPISFENFEKDQSTGELSIAKAHDMAVPKSEAQSKSSWCGGVCTILKDAPVVCTPFPSDCGSFFGQQTRTRTRRK